MINLTRMRVGVISSIGSLKHVSIIDYYLKVARETIPCKSMTYAKCLIPILLFALGFRQRWCAYETDYCAIRVSSYYRDKNSVAL
jgi:hypothetical protein